MSKKLCLHRPDGNAAVIVRATLEKGRCFNCASTAPRETPPSLDKRAESAEAVTRLEIERLDALMAAVWEKAEGGELAAIDRVLAIMARRAKLLGIDAEKPANPSVALQNVNVNVEALTDAQRAEAIRALLARAGAVLSGSPGVGRIEQAAYLGDGGNGQDSDGTVQPSRPVLGGTAEVNGRCRADAGPLADDVPPFFG